MNDYFLNLVKSLESKSSNKQRDLNNLSDSFIYLNIFQSDSPIEYDSNLFSLVNISARVYDEFDFLRTPCSRCPESGERVFTKIYEFNLIKGFKFYSVGLKREVPDFLYRDLSEASLSWNIKVRNYLSEVYHSEPFKLSMISVLSFILLIGFAETEIKYIFLPLTIFCTILTLKADKFAEIYMNLISKEDYGNKLSLSLLERFFKKITKFFIKESGSIFNSSEERIIDNFSKDIDSVHLDSYRTFRLNLVSLKFNLNQIDNLLFVDKAREGLGLGIELAKYLELHRDKIVYSKEFFNSIEKLLKLSKVLLDNQNYSSRKKREIDLKSLKLLDDLIKILNYLFDSILDYDKDELLARLKVMEMDIKSMSSYVDLKELG